MVQPKDPTFDYARRRTFRWSNLFLRALWGAVYSLLFRLSPRPLFGFRRVLLRCFGAEIGEGVKIYPHVRIWAPWNLKADAFSGLGDYVIVYNLADVSLARGVVVSQYAHLCTGSRDISTPGFGLIAKPIRIGQRAWIATEAFVGPGVTIGEESVVAARAVVVKDVPPYTVVAGNPARRIKQRDRTGFERQIER